ncbi:hypothetical protein [Flavobacterium sp. H122]|uniref:hypothetical protein n=1 Tax=Flavobacterium sp. H122 TaxID=2529860 RepID=UPI00145A10E1|nr:hypothetical protein [Flavobacterium sp. H122]
MKKNSYLIKSLFFLGFFLVSSISQAQNDSIPKSKGEFWEKVRFGGGLGLNLGSGFTSVSVSPAMYYNFNSSTALGIGVTGSYIEDSGEYNSWIYGGSAIGLYNPIEYIQLSAEIEQLRVNVKVDSNLGYGSDNFWNTALFLGAGYRANNFTVGLRYNVLYNENDRIYADAWIPFVRVMF